MDSTKYRIQTTAVQVFLASILLTCLKILQLGRLVEVNHYANWQLMIFQNWVVTVQHLAAETVKTTMSENVKTSLELIQLTNFIACTIVLQLLSINFENPKIPEQRTNRLYLIQSLVQFLGILVFYLAKYFTLLES